MSNAEGSDFDRMFYPFLFEREKVNPDDVLAQVRHSTLEKCHEVVALRRTMLNESGQQIIAIARAMAHAFASGATLLAFGNGGSTTDVQDMVTQLLNPHDPTWPALPAIALTNDIAVITAVGNDVGFDNIFRAKLSRLDMRTISRSASPPVAIHRISSRHLNRQNGRGCSQSQWLAMTVASWHVHTR